MVQILPRLHLFPTLDLAENPVGVFSNLQFLWPEEDLLFYVGQGPRHDESNGFVISGDNI